MAIPDSQTDKISFISISKRKSGFNIPLIAIYSIVILVYISSAFRLAEIFELKRILQSVLLFPVFWGFLYHFKLKSESIFHPLIVFIFIKLTLEIIWRSNFAFISESLMLIMALFVLNSASYHTIVKGANALIIIATFFAILGLVQWFLFFIQPEYTGNSIELLEDGTLIKGNYEIISYLGFFSTRGWSLFGIPMARHFSFAREPSLVLIFFYFPAVLALLLNKEKFKYYFIILCTYSILSFSGSVFLALFFGFTFWLILRFMSLRVLFPSGILAIMFAYVLFIKANGEAYFLGLSASLGEFNSLFYKTSSISGRTRPVADNFQVMLSSPLGAGSLSHDAGPWLINAGIATGWLGIMCITIFLFRLRLQMDFYQRINKTSNEAKIGISLLIGVLAVFIIFNDYEMTSYSGLVIIMFIQRVLQMAPNNTKVLNISAPFYMNK